MSPRKIDATTPAGKLQMHILGAIAEFERGRIVERVRAGLARAKAQGKRLGRQPYAITDAQFEAVADRSLRDAAQALGVSRSVVHRWRLSRKPLGIRRGFRLECFSNSAGRGVTPAVTQTDDCVTALETCWRRISVAVSEHHALRGRLRIEDIQRATRAVAHAIATIDR